MTDREKAIIMAYTGYCMLAGDKLKVFYEYVGELLGRPVYTHEFADPDIREKASDDFYKLCRETTPEDMDDLQKDADYWHKLAQSYAHMICEMSKVIAEHGEKQWIPCSERLPEYDEEVLCFTSSEEMVVGHLEDEWGQNVWTTGKFASGTFDAFAWMPLPQPWKGEQK